MRSWTQVRFRIIIVCLRKTYTLCHGHTFTRKLPTRIKEPCTCARKTLFPTLRGAWVSRGSYRVHVAVIGSTWWLRDLCPALFRENSIAWPLRDGCARRCERAIKLSVEACLCRGHTFA